MVSGLQFFWMVTKVFGYIISLSRGLCGGVMCVLFIWLVGACLLGVCYGVGTLCLGNGGCLMVGRRGVYM